MRGGIILPIFEKMRLEYSYLAPGAMQNTAIVRDIDVAPFYRIQLVIRVHAITMAGGAGQGFSFVLHNTLPSDVDPREFSETTSFLRVSFSSGAPPTPPTIKSGTATDPRAFLKLTAVASQAIAASATLYGEFSGVLVLRRE